MGWQPITDLTEADRGLWDPGVKALATAVNEHFARLSRPELEEYLERLRRSWAIETGIIERLYEVSESATKTLIERGLDAAYLASSDTGPRAPREVVNILKDQKDAIDGIYTFVEQGGELSRSLLRQMHQQMTAHQETYEAEDPGGNPVILPMPKGEWKTQSNRVGRVECCPPIQVDGEIDRLLTMSREHREMGVPAAVDAAWLHHRFLLIHPFADGNGRIARCLATIVLLRDRMMPLSVDRKKRADYIDGLRAADAGDLGPFVRFIEEIQRLELGRALQIASDMSRERGIQAARTESLREKFLRRARQSEKVRKVLLALASEVYRVIEKEMHDEHARVVPLLKEADPSFDCWLDHAEHGSDRARFNWFQVTRCAKTLEYFANSNAYQAWWCLAFRIDSERPELLASIHGVGLGTTNVLGCTVMRYERFEAGSVSGDKLGEVHPLVDYPFTFTGSERPINVLDRLRPWLQKAIQRGTDEISERV